MVKEAANRILGHGDNKKSPISVDIIKKVIDKFTCINASLQDLRVALMCILAFMGFLRFDELSRIRFSDIVIQQEFVKIFIERSKTDVYRDGHWLYISSLNSNYCPVRILRCYLAKAKFSEYSDKYIFRAITRNKVESKRILKKTNRPLSYTTTRAIILQAFRSVGEEVSALGVHSLRAGGATAAANCGVPDRLFKKHGRWLSDKSKDRYVSEDIRNKLFVSKNLGL